jgi:hypothetical protein
MSSFNEIKVLEPCALQRGSTDGGGRLANVTCFGLLHIAKCH